MANPLMSPLTQLGNDIISSGRNAGNNSSSDTSESPVPDWPDCNPGAVIACMKKLKEDRIGNNRKCFYKTYSSVWSQLSDTQQCNSLAFFHKLEEPVKIAVLNQARTFTTDTESADKSRAEAVTKDDLARIIELFLWPAAQVHIANALGTLKRRDLDARNSSAPDITGENSLADAAGAWRKLTTIYMDYVGFAPQNALIAYTNNADGEPVPVVPFRAADEEMVSVVARCHDLRPTNLSRAGIVRDEVWLKAQTTQLRTSISSVLADFNRSGMQNGRDEADVVWLSPEEQQRWVWHAHNKSRRYPAVLSYAFGRLEQPTLESLGRGSGVSGRDSSVDGKNGGSAQKANSARHERKKKRARTNEKSGGGNDPLATALEAATQLDMQYQCITFKIQHAPTQEMKIAAYEELLLFQERVSKAATTSSSLLHEENGDDEEMSQQHDDDVPPSDNEFDDNDGDSYNSY